MAKEIKRERRVFAIYLANVFAYLDHGNEAMHLQMAYANPPAHPSELLMRRIEEEIDIPEQGADDFRRLIASYIAYLGTEVTWPDGYDGEPLLVAHEEKIDWDCHSELKKGIELYCQKFSADDDIR